MPVLLLGRMIVGIETAYEEMNYMCCVDVRGNLLGCIALTIMSHCSVACLIESLMLTIV